MTVGRVSSTRTRSRRRAGRLACELPLSFGDSGGDLKPSPVRAHPNQPLPCLTIMFLPGFSWNFSRKNQFLPIKHTTACSFKKLLPPAWLHNIKHAKKWLICEWSFPFIYMWTKTIRTQVYKGTTKHREFEISLSYDNREKSKYQEIEIEIEIQNLRVGIIDLCRQYNYHCTRLGSAHDNH